MEVWFAAALAVTGLVMGIRLFHIGTKTQKKIWVAIGSVLFILGVLCVVYLMAVWLLLGGIG